MKEITQKGGRQMIEYSKFYKAESRPTNDKNRENETELEKYKKLIQKLGYAHFDD